MLKNGLRLKTHFWEKILRGVIVLLFAWFLLSSFSIAYYKSLQRDDAMFASIAKNVLTGYGWATGYGEKIPFNPDISTGPTLIVPAMAMIALFGNQVWVPAMTGAVMNTLLLLLIAWQLPAVVRNRLASVFALLMAVSLFMVNDFKTFSAYYTGALLLVFALLFVLNPRHRVKTRLLVFGALAAIGLYAKPLIFQSFLVAGVLLIVFFAISAIFSSKTTGTSSVECRVLLFQMLKQSIWHGFFIVAACIAVLLPWHIYKHVQLSGYEPEYQQAYHDYKKQFFEEHGSGIAQWRAAKNKIVHLKNNAGKNFRLLRKFVSVENGLPIWIFISAMVVAGLVGLGALLLCWKKNSTCRNKLHFFCNPDNVTGSAAFVFILASVSLVGLLWFVVFSFAMTPGHSWFYVFFTLLLLLLLAANISKNSFIGVVLVVFCMPLLSERLAPMVEAYSFKAQDSIVFNEELLEFVEKVKSHSAKYPQASCSYSGGTWRVDYLLPTSGNFLDCFNVYEDSLILDDAAYQRDNPDIDFLVDDKLLTPTQHFFTQGQHHQVQASFSWQGEPNLTLVLELPGFIMAGGAYYYLLEPIGDICKKHIQFVVGSTYAVCDIPFAELAQYIEPTELARNLVDYQAWYRTRIKAY